MSLSPVSLPSSMETRLLTESDLPRNEMLFLWDLGVGHSIGLVDLDDAATDEDGLRSS